jgi:hypothetical protein
MSQYVYDFAKLNDTVPMVDFLESLSIKERALVYKNMEKLIEFKNNNHSLSE